MTNKELKNIKIESDTIIQFISFFVDKRELAAGILDVVEILKEINITPIPRAPEYLLGLMNLRGDVIPVIDLRKRLGIEGENENKQDSRILVINQDNNMFGMKVDSVAEVQRVSIKRIEEPPKLTKGIEKNWLTGIVKYKEENRLVMMINLKETMNINFKQKDSEKYGQLLKDDSVKAKNKKGKEEEQYVTFFIGVEEFGIAIHSIHEILKIKEITAIPNVPDFVMGIQNIRGDVIPVISTRVLVNKESINNEVKSFTRKLKSEFDVIKDLVLKWFNNSGEVKLPIDSKNLTILNIFNRRKGVLKNIEVVNDPMKESFNNLIEDFKIIMSSKEFNNINNPDVFKERCLKKITTIDVLLKSLNDVFINEFKRMQRILIVEVEGMSVGLFVDMVTAVKSIEKKNIDNTPSIISTYGEEIKGVAKLDEGKRLILLTDEKKLISKEDVELLSKINPEEETKEKDEDKTDIKQYVIFSVEEEEFGLKIEIVKEIFKPQNITPIPNTEKFIKGLTNLRGEIIPIIDIRERFGIKMREKKYEKFFKILSEDFNSHIEKLENRIKNKKPQKNALFGKSSKLVKTLKTLESDPNEWIIEKTKEIGILIGNLENDLKTLAKELNIDYNKGFNEFLKLKTSEINTIKTKLQNLSLEEINEQSLKLLVVSMNNVLIGLLVGDVKEVLRVPETDIEDAPSLIVSNIESNYLEGIAKLNEGERIILILKIEKIMSVSDYNKLMSLTIKPKVNSKEKKIKSNKTLKIME